MKLQFSLATLLVCVTVLAVVCAIAVTIPAHELVKAGTPGITAFFNGRPVYETYNSDRICPRLLTGWDIVTRVVLWGTPTIFVTLAALWLIRRLRQPNRPPV